MADSEDPFQMDEDLLSYTPSYLPVNDESIQRDHEYIRSQIQEIELKKLSKSQEFPQNEQDNLEMQYDEDIDDKYQPSQNDNHPQNHHLSQDLPLTPPENFALVINNIYRSSFPQPQNFPFLQRLKLKSILCLIPEEYPEEHREFFHQQNIQLFQLGMSGNKEPFVIISHELITEALKIILDPKNQPVLIHCNRGKHRTGCLVGVLRRLQQWSLTIIFDEYRKFAAPKERPMDQQFIELYNEDDIRKYCEENNLLPLRWD